jgi:cytochrome b6-f complex iron-sulfur subunit
MFKKLSFLLLLLVLSLGAMAAAKQAADQTQKIDLGPVEAWQPGTVKAMPQFKIIVFSDKDGVYAISSTCTHLGCTVRVKDKLLVCPCHGAQYGVDGVVLRGPAKADLGWFQISRGADGRLSVDKTKTVPRGTKWRAP